MHDANRAKENIVLIPIVLAMLAIALAVLLCYKPEWAINICVALIVCAIIYGLVFVIGAAWTPAHDACSYIVDHVKQIFVGTLVLFCALGGIK